MCILRRFASTHHAYLCVYAFVFVIFIKMCGLLHALLLWSLLQRYRTLCLARNMDDLYLDLLVIFLKLMFYTLYSVLHTTNIEEKYVYLCTLLRFVFETIMPSLLAVAYCCELSLYAHQWISVTSTICMWGLSEKLIRLLVKIYSRSV